MTTRGIRTTREDILKKEREGKGGRKGKKGSKTNTQGQVFVCTPSIFQESFQEEVLSHTLCSKIMPSTVFFVWMAIGVIALTLYVLYPYMVRRKEGFATTETSAIDALHNLDFANFPPELQDIMQQVAIRSAETEQKQKEKEDSVNAKTADALYKQFQKFQGGKPTEKANIQELESLLGISAKSIQSLPVTEGFDTMTANQTPTATEVASLTKLKGLIEKAIGLRNNLTQLPVTFNPIERTRMEQASLTLTTISQVLSEGWNLGPNNFFRTRLTESVETFEKGIVPKLEAAVNAPSTSGSAGNGTTAGNASLMPTATEVRIITKLKDSISRTKALRKQIRDEAVTDMTPIQRVKLNNSEELAKYLDDVLQKGWPSATARTFMITRKLPEIEFEFNTDLEPMLERVIREQNTISPVPDMNKVMGGSSSGTRTLPDDFETMSSQPSQTVDQEVDVSPAESQGQTLRKNCTPTPPACKPKPKPVCKPKPEPKPACKCPDMRDYVRKDSIPCWACKL